MPDDRRYAVPKTGLRVRTPDGTILNEEGGWVALDKFWRRRAADGDVTLTKSKPAAKEAKSEKPAPSRDDAKKGASA